MRKPHSNYTVCLFFIVGTLAGCARQEANEAALVQAGELIFEGGHNIDPQDHGRPVVLIGNALGVTPKIFRDAFSGVTPSDFGPPGPGRARANKKVLMDKLSPHGVTNDRLDEVSDFYRYDPGRVGLWSHRPARATAVLEGGKIIGIKIIDGGAGYTTPPSVRILGFDNVTLIASIEFSTDLKTNGRISSISILKASVR